MRIERFTWELRKSASKTCLTTSGNQSNLILHAKVAPVSSTTTKNFKSIIFTIQELFHEEATVLKFETDSSSKNFKLNRG